MDLVGNDWLNLTAGLAVQDGPLPGYHAVGRHRRSIRSHALAAVGLLRSTDLPYYYELATQFTTDDAWHSPMPANTVPNRMYLFAATSYGHAFPPNNPSDPAWQRPTVLPRPDGTRESPGVTTTRTTASSWRTGRTGTIPRSRGTCATFRSTTTFWPAPTPTRAAAGGVHRARQLRPDCDEHPGNNVQTGAVDAAEHHQCPAHQHGVAGLGVHPHLG